jgi:hypothetical protein
MTEVGVKIREYASFYSSAEAVDPESWQSYNDITGFGVWALSNSLLRLLQRNAQDVDAGQVQGNPHIDPRFDPRGKCVVEIGAGSGTFISPLHSARPDCRFAGALSIGASKLGAKHVVATDLAQNIDYIRANIADNEAQRTVVAQQVLKLHRECTVRPRIPPRTLARPPPPPSTNSHFHCFQSEHCARSSFNPTYCAAQSLTGVVKKTQQR